MASNVTAVVYTKTDDFYSFYKDQTGSVAWTQRNVTCRLMHAGNMLLCPVTGLFDMFVGSFNCVGAIATFGASKLSNKMSFQYHIGAWAFTSRTFGQILKTLNPAAELTPQELLTDNVHRRLEKMLNDVKNEKSFFLKHGVTRLTAAAVGLTSIATRVIDLAIGVLAASFALLTVGNFSELNSIALKGLALPLLVHDVAILGILGFINPHAEGV